MGKRLFISEKPSVAQEFARALDISFQKRDGYLEAPDTIVTWCVGHLVTMAYPDAYDEKYKKWSLATIPFIPDHFRYEIIENVRKQFDIVKRLLTSSDVDTIYVCTDSGREGEYIYRLVAQEAGVHDKRQLRVWIDSQTKEEILRGIREAKEESFYDNLGASAYLRAKEDYLMGINFSRAISLKYASGIRDFLGMDRCVIAVGRVMTCVLGIVVTREREIRSFVKTPFYRIAANFGGIATMWQVTDDSKYHGSPLLYGEKGFREREAAETFLKELKEVSEGVVHAVSRKKETKSAPLLYNLAELQNDCARFFRISPDQTLQIAQELYEKKLTTYPRTDARVLSSAVAKEIGHNLKGIGSIGAFAPFVGEIFKSGAHQRIAKSRYVNDKAITDHYAIIPTGEGLSAIAGLAPLSRNVYEIIVRRFLAVFYPAAVFDKMQLEVKAGSEHFFASAKSCREEGYQAVLSYSFRKEKKAEGMEEAEADEEDAAVSTQVLASLKKGVSLPLSETEIRQGETTPPKRYNSGSMILTMENAGQFIEEEELREQIRGSGIGTSATRAEILNKLVRNRYLTLNKKTQILTPTQLGEMIHDCVEMSVRPLLNPRLTASWEIGLTRVAQGEVTEEEYLTKLNDFIRRRTEHIKETSFGARLQQRYREIAAFYPQRAAEREKAREPKTRIRRKEQCK